MIAENHPALKKFRAIRQKPPATSERRSHGSPTFFAGKPSFLSLMDNHHNDGRLAICCAAPFGAQDTWVTADPEHFFRPAYVGPRGWLGARLDRDLTWDEIEKFVRQAHAMVAPQPRAARGPRSSSGGRKPPRR